MRTSLELTVVVPVMDEAEGISAFARELYAAVAQLDLSSEVIFVDDHSTDGTQALLATLGATVVRHASNRGYGASLKTGIAQARGRFVCIIDADHELSPADIARLLPHADAHDMVVGARVGARARPFPWHQRVAKTFVCSLLRWWFGLDVRDINSGLRLFPRVLVRDYLDVMPDGFSFTSSITLAMLLDRRRIGYVPVAYRPRLGTTKVRVVSYTTRFIRSYARVCWHYCRVRGRRT